MQRKLFEYQKDLFVRCEKNFQGEIAIRSRDIAISKKVPLECSEDRATHQVCNTDNYDSLYAWPVTNAPHTAI